MRRLTIVFFILWTALLVKGKESSPNGIRFIGVGYHLINGNPEGGDANNGGIDPGLLSTRQILALTFDEGRITNGFPVPDEVTFSPRQSCVKESSQSTFYGTRSYQNSLRVGVSVSVRYLWFFAFSGSFGYNSVQSSTSKNHRVYFENTEVCNLGRARYREELASQFSITDGFASGSCELSTTYNETQYMDFLDDWGTHVVVEVDIGNKVIQRFEASRSEFLTYAMKNIGGSVSVGGWFRGLSASLKVNVNSYSSSSSSASQFGTSSYTFRIGDEDLQEPIHIRIIPIIDVFKQKYWTSLPNFIEKGICDGTFSLKKVRANIHRALTRYAQWKNLEPSSDPSLTIPITWPKGTYGLPMPTSGCPQETWKTGFRKQGTEWLSIKSDPMHLDVINTYYHTTQKFCMKTEDEQVMDEWIFQEGHYCIYRKGNECPSEFSEGNIRWDDNGHFADGVGGSLPDGSYNHYTTIYFCCRSDGFYENPILLPTDKPFILFANSLECQQVYGMNVTKEWFRWRTDDQGNVDRYEGSLPNTGPSRLTLTFCYYESNQD